MRTLTASLVLALASPAFADVIHLKSGGSLEGVILKDAEGSVVVRLKYATVTIDRSDIDSIEKKAAEPGPAAARPMRLPRWDRCIEVVAVRPWAGALRQIPATVVDTGILKHVPYMSHKSGNTEFNLYGDPEAPACLEIGVYKEFIKSEAAKKECLDVMAALLGDPKDVEILRSLNLAPGKKERDGLTFEITPETAEDAYGGWWISVYDAKALDQARATEEELRQITMDEEEVEKEEKEEQEAQKKQPRPDPKKVEPKKPAPPQEYIGFNPYLWQKKDLQHSRPVKKTSSVKGLRRVYIRGYSRPKGVYGRPGGIRIRR